MENQEFQKLVKELQNAEVQLPLHQKVLRERLLKAHHPHTGRRQRALSAVKTHLESGQALLSGRKVLSVGVVIALVSLILLGVALFHPGSHKAGPKQIIASALPAATQSPATSMVASATTPRPQTHSQGSSADVSEQPSLKTPDMPEPISQIPASNSSTSPSANSSNNKNKTKIVVKVKGHSYETIVDVEVNADGSEDKSEAKEEKKAIKAAIKAQIKADKGQPLGALTGGAALKLDGVSLLLGVNSND